MIYDENDADLMLPKVSNVVLEVQGSSFRLKGTLCVEDHSLVLFDDGIAVHKESASKCNSSESGIVIPAISLPINRNGLQDKFPVPFRVSYQLIDSMQETITLSAPPSFSLLCRHFYIFKFFFIDVNTCTSVAQNIRSRKEKMLTQLRFLPAFNYKHGNDDLQAGWSLFPVSEYFDTLVKKATRMEWRQCTVNKGFDVCPTYPEMLIVPKDLSDETIRESARFRDGGRFPIVCYLHEPRQTTLLRSSQPLVTALNKTCACDESLLQICAPSTGSKKISYIVDMRNSADAASDKVRGGGMENDQDYRSFHYFQRPIERVSNLLESFAKLMKALRTTHCTVDQYMSAIESSKWLDNLRILFSNAALAVQIMHNESSSILIHGMEGRDTTLCVTTLAQLIADPACRTFVGFQHLIHREWVLSGFQFAHRNSSQMIQNRPKDSRRVASPVFLFCLDAIWQYIRCFPSYFEFNEAFLEFLGEHAYSCMFGNFLCNSELERVTNAVYSQTQSLWQYLQDPNISKKFINPLYEPKKSVVLLPVSPGTFIPWSSFYLRKESVISQILVEKAAEAKAMNKQLITQAEILRNELKKLRQRNVKRSSDC